MLYPIKKRSWLFLTSLLFGLSLVLGLGAQRTSACGACPHKKGSASSEKTGEQSCPRHSKATPDNPSHSSKLEMKQTAVGISQEIKGADLTKSQAYTCPMHPKITSDTPGNCGKCGMKLVLTDTPAKDNLHAHQVTNPEAFKKVTGYGCPMHSEVVKKKKGNCPECRMKLEKREFYEVYVCPMKECSHISEKGGKCCGMKLNKKLMSSEEFDKLIQVPVEYICPMHPEVISSEAGNCPKCGMKLEKKTRPESEERLTYFCPMHPKVSSDKPGSCFKCGMKLKMSTILDQESSKM